LAEESRLQSSGPFRRQLARLLIVALALSGIGQGAWAAWSIALGQGTDVLVSAEAGSGDARALVTGVAEQASLVVAGNDRNPDLLGPAHGWPKARLAAAAGSGPDAASSSAGADHQARCCAISASRALTGPPA
jgi:hypothetical protein